MLITNESTNTSRSILTSLNIAGMSVAIFNPRLDTDGSIAKNIVESMGSIFSSF